MDPITLIITALAVGAALSLKEASNSAVKDAYAELRTLARRRLAERPRGELILVEYEQVPEDWEAPLTSELTAAGANNDAELLAAAQTLMGLVDEEGRRAGKYTIVLGHSHGM